MQALSSAAITTRPRARRQASTVCVVVATSGTTALVAGALRSNLVFFYAPPQVAAKESRAGRPFHFGGLVQCGNPERDGATNCHLISDTMRKVPVRFDGVSPDPFKEGKGVGARGQVSADGAFAAREVLAKHDAHDMPPDTGEALTRACAGQMPVEVGP